MAQPAPVALLFPGQGSQTDDMAEMVERHRPDLRSLLADELGSDAFERVEEGTAFAQPALYCASLAGWAAAGEPEASLLAGHSLGELAALVASGSLDPRDGLRLAIARGRLMQEAAAHGAEGGMLAMLGDPEKTRAIAADAGLVVANDNAPGQLVLSGEEERLRSAERAGRAAGLRAMRLRVQGPFHSPAMTPALAGFRAVLSDTPFAPPGSTVVSGTTAAPFDDVRERLAEALVRPVRWRETLLTMRRLGARRFLETGPGRVLTGLVRRTLQGVEAGPLGEADAIRV